MLGLLYAAFVHSKVDEMENIAKAEGVPVHYVDANTITAHPGISVKHVLGLYDPKRNFIMIDERQKLDAYILAHELGHYFAIKHWNDCSEETADDIAVNLLKHGKKYLEVFD